jgi:hypothetical protein
MRGEPCLNSYEELSDIMVRQPYLVKYLSKPINGQPPLDDMRMSSVI